MCSPFYRVGHLADLCLLPGAVLCLFCTRNYFMSIDQISLPKGAGPHAEKLFEAITQAGTVSELNRAGGKAEGFVLGLETAKAIKSQIAERLYVVYDDAATQRETELTA
jgi:hypothetical protein